MIVEELPGKRVVVAEDNPVLAFDIDEILRKFGIEVVGPALDLEAGLRLARENALDSAVLDIDLGGHRVWPVATQLKSSSIPFVFVSADCGDDIPSEFREAICLGKPARGETIAATVNQVLAAR